MSNKILLPESLTDIDSEMDLEKLEILYSNHSTVIGKICRIDFENQLFIVDLGGKLSAKMPFSESTIYPIMHPDNNRYSINIMNLFEQTIQAKIKVFKKDNIILSRKANMLEALEILKAEKDSIFAIVTGFSKLSAFVDMGAGIIGRSYSRNFCNTIFKDVKDLGIKKGDLISVKIINFLQDSNNFELSRVDTLPSCEEFLDRGDTVNCTVFSPVGDNLGYYVLIETMFCGIVDSPEVELNYGDKIRAFIKNVTPKGPKLNYLEKI